MVQALSNALTQQRLRRLPVHGYARRGQTTDVAHPWPVAQLPGADGNGITAARPAAVCQACIGHR